MSEDFGNTYVVLTDEEGNEKEFEHIDTVGYNGETYMAFIPAGIEVGEEAEVVILKVTEEDGEEILLSVDDDEEADRVFELVMNDVDAMFDDAEEDDPTDGDEPGEENCSSFPTKTLLHPALYDSLHFLTHIS